jgi:hypothetical protein
MKPSKASLRHIRTACVGAFLSVACQMASADNPLDDPAAGSRVPDGTTKFTQTREQNAVTSVRVQRGDNVRRGQTIGRVGSSGGVATPQLHFEVRRGTRAVNPTEYLGSQSASN